jgi:hypothetical protein
MGFNDSDFVIEWCGAREELFRQIDNFAGNLQLADYRIINPATFKGFCAAARDLLERQVRAWHPANYEQNSPGDIGFYDALADDDVLRPTLDEFVQLRNAYPKLSRVSGWDKLTTELADHTGISQRELTDNYFYFLARSTLNTFVDKAVDRIAQDRRAFDNPDKYDDAYMAASDYVMTRAREARIPILLGPGG